MEEECHSNLESPSTPLTPSPKDELIHKPEKFSKEVDDEKAGNNGNGNGNGESKPKLSLRLRSKKRKKSASPQNGADCESQNSFSRTSSTCGYRESFGNKCLLLLCLL